MIINKFILKQIDNSYSDNQRCENNSFIYEEIVNLFMYCFPSGNITL